MQKWDPDKLLCIRFGIKHPEENKEAVHAEVAREKREVREVVDGNDFYNLIASEVKDL